MKYPIAALAIALALGGRVAYGDVQYNVVDLGTFGGPYSAALGINNKGQVVGSATDGSPNRHAFLWDSTNGLQNLGTLPGTLRSFANGINENGQVVGYTEDSAGARRAFLWQSGTECRTSARS